MQRIQLASAETDDIDSLLAEIMRSYGQPFSEEFLTDVVVWSHQLPVRLRREINRQRLTDQNSGITVLSGFPIDDQRIGPTPPTLEAAAASQSARREEFFLMLVSSLFGDLIAWATQQAGRLLHDVFPIRQHQDMQLGTGCRQLLTWHTEDAFHPYRSDYVAMLCLRNPQQVPTTVASIAQLELDAETKSLLFQPCYAILPDESHRGTTGLVDPAGESANSIALRLREPEKIAVLFGDFDRPYLRLDPYFMPAPDDEPKRRALEVLIEKIDFQLVDLVLQPGELCIMDNYRVVHGRRPFEARFDGTDRWLKRALMVRDLRKSVDARSRSNSRVINK